MSAHQLITDHLDLWTQAVTQKSTAGRGSNGKVELTGIKKLRELILELAVRGKLVEQDANDEPASVLLERIEEEKTRLAKEGKIKKPKKQLPDTLGDENLFSLPYGWQWASIACTGIASTGKTPSTKIKSFFDGDIPFIGPGQITPSGRINTPDKFISEEGILESDEALPGDIVVVCIGGSIGKCAKVQERCGFNQQINKIRPMLVHSDYLLSALSTDFIQKTILEKSTGSATPIINRSKWESICIPLPPINEQHRIVQKADELMALCDRLEQHTSNQLDARETLVVTLLGTLTQSANATELADNWALLAEHFDTLFTTEQSIDKLKQTILQLAVMGRLVEQDDGDEPAEQLIERIATQKAETGNGKRRASKPPKSSTAGSQPFQIPSTWAWMPLRKTGITSTGKTPSTKNASFFSGNIPFIGPGQVTAAGKINTPEKHLSEEGILQSEEALSGDILTVCIGGSIGKTAIVTERCGFNQQLNKIRPVLVEPSYLLAAINADFFQHSIREKATGSATPIINRSKWESIAIPLAPLAEQRRIVQKVDELMALCDRLKQRLTQASDTRCQLAGAVVEQAIN